MPQKTSRYKKGDQWSATDANYVIDNVRRLENYHELLANLEEGTTIILCVAVNDILPDETGEAIIYVGDADPPTLPIPVFPEERLDATLDWMHQGQKVSAGKLMAVVPFGDMFRIMWAECEDPLPPSIAQIGLGAPPSFQSLTTTFGNIVDMSLSYESGSGIAWDGSASGFAITEKGTWIIGINFIIESTANNAIVLMRVLTPDGPGPVTILGIKTSGDTVSGSLDGIASITDGDLPTALVFQVATDAGTEDVNWLSAQIVCSRIGVDNG